MSRVLWIALCAAGLAFPQGGILTPWIGLVRDGAGSLRPVWGVRGNFLTGDVWLDGARAASFSGRFAMVKTAEEIRVLGAGGELLASQATVGDDALFAFASDGEPLLAVVSGVAWRWTGDRLEEAPWLLAGLDGTPVAVAAAGQRAVALVVRRDDSLWLIRQSLDDGATLFEALLPDVQAPVYLDPDGTLLFADEEELVVRRPDSSEVRLPAPTTIPGFERMGEHWIRCGPFAVRLEGGAAELFRLPGGGAR